jgi:hypothetical protein
MQAWFGKDKKEEESLSETTSSDSLSDFQDALERSLTEEKTQIVADKKQHNKVIAMVKLLLDNGYTMDDVNALIHVKKSYQLKDGQIIEK